MRWDDVLTAITTAVQADATLVSVFGVANMRAEVEWAEQIVPGLSYRVVGDTVTELWEPHVVQFDIWATTLEDLAAGERALRALMDNGGPVSLGGMYCYCYFTDGTPLGATVGPDRSNYYGRAARFRILPIREALRPGRTA